VRWCVGWRSRLYRRLGRKIEEGRELAGRDPEISFDEQKHWDSTAKEILAKDLGGWSPEIGAFEDGGDRVRNPFGRGNLTPKEVVARQIKVLQQIQTGLYDPSASVRTRVIVTSHPSRMLVHV
jgi:hypothetical protein